MRRKFLISLLLAVATFCLCGASYAKTPTVLNDNEATIMVPKTTLTLEEYVEEIHAINENLVNSWKDTPVNERNLATSAPQEAPTTITFAKRMSFTEVESFVTKHNINGFVLESRALMDDGTKMTFWTRLNNGYDSAEKSLMKALADNSCKDFLGFVGMYASVPLESFEDVENDTATFLLDASQGNLYYDSADASAENLHKANATPTFPKTLSWQLEELKTIR